MWVLVDIVLLMHLICVCNCDVVAVLIYLLCDSL